MKKYFPWILAFFVVVVVFWIGNWYFVTNFIDNWSDRGTYGDMFGAANALFSGLAFVGLIYTILLQREELKESTKALQQQAKELKFTVEESQTQNETLRIQQFENTFFQLLKKLDESSKVVRYVHGGNVIDNGDKAFAQYNFLLEQPDIDYRHVLGQFLGEGGYGGSFFRLFIQIVKYIKLSDFIDNEVKHRYINILRAYLTFEQIHFFKKISAKDPNFKELTDIYGLYEDHLY